MDTSWFANWQREYRARRDQRRADLIAALRAGRKILHHGKIWPDIAAFVFVPSARSPEHLGAHIENREAGFGFVTRILAPGDESDPTIRAAIDATARVLRGGEE